MLAHTVGELKQIAANEMSQSEADLVLAGSTTEGLYDLLEEWVQRVMSRIGRKRDWRFLEERWTLTWPSTGVLYYPHDLDHVVSLFPGSSEARNRPLRIMRARSYDERVRQNGGTYGRDVLVEWGQYGVESDMPAAGTVDATTGDAGDATTVVVVEGRDANNRKQTEVLTLDAVDGSASGSSTFRSGAGGVRRVYVRGSAAGSGRVTVSSGGTTLAVIDSGVERMREHQRTELYGIGGAGATYDCRGIRRICNVTNDGDVIDLPTDFHHVPIAGVKSELAKFRKQFQEALMWETEFQNGLNELSNWDNARPGVVMALRPARRRRR